MRKIVIAGVAAALLCLAGFTQNAQAQCVWAGTVWACPPVASVIVPMPYTVIYPAPNPAYGRYGWTWWGPEQPNDNPGAGTGN